MHNHALAPVFAPKAPAQRRRRRPAAQHSVEPIVRMAQATDIEQIAALVNGFADQGLMLPRSTDDVLRELPNYVVAATPSGRVMACAALSEYSPSLAEVSSVAVHADAHGHGLGTRVVLAVERVARLRDIDEVFAMSLSPRFFTQLGYEEVALDRYPEKVARYDRMRAAGHIVVEKGCFRKIVGAN